MSLTLDSQELTTVSKQLADATLPQDVEHILQSVKEKYNITQSSNHTRKVNLYHHSVWLGVYRSAANACRNLGFTIGTDSAKRVLARHGYTMVQDD